jgi:penicillin amidase
MKTFKRILFVVVIILVLSILASFLYLRKIQKQAIPDYSSDIHVKGLSSEVEVFRDKFGIPHIYADNEADLYKVTGYIMAQERMWQMDLLRRVTTGRLSEIFGETMVKADLTMRALQIPAKSKLVLEKTDSTILDALRNFAAGVNQYIETNQDKLAPEFVLLGYKPEPWEIEHSVNMVGYMGWDLRHGWNEDLLLSGLAAKLDSAHFCTIVPDMKNQPTSVYPNFKLQQKALNESLLSSIENLDDLGIEVFNASNSWAVSGKKSETGQPLLANDMHLGLNAPGIWMQIHQVIRDKLNVTGVALPGQPLVVCGHNDSIAWGMTNVAVDNLDLYQEKINETQDKYFFNGEWKPLRIEKFSIKTKEGNTHEKTLRFTHRGPLVSEIKEVKDKQLSMRWSGSDYSNEIRGVYLLNRAKNWIDFRDAASSFSAVSQNIVYADVNDNIGLQCSAGIPIRKGDGFLVHSGETDEYDWKGYVPFNELPFEYNPPRGYVSSANNKTVPEDYPYFISHWFSMPYRIGRIREMLEAKEKLSVADFEVMQSDCQSKLVETYLGKFVKALEDGQLTGETELKVLDLLHRWDGRMERESAATTVFETLFKNLIRNMVSDELDPELTKQVMRNQTMSENLLVSSLSSKIPVWFDNIKTEKKETFEDLLVESFKTTVTDLAQKLGKNPTDWQWQKVHTLTLNHAMGKIKMLNLLFGLNSKTFGMPGSSHTVCPYSYSFNAPYQADHGASQRHIFDVGGWDYSETVIPTGTSGIPGSPNYCDQTDLYINNKYHTDYFTEQKVQNSAVTKMKFLPKYAKSGQDLTKKNKKNSLKNSISFPDKAAKRAQKRS